MRGRHHFLCHIQRARSFQYRSGVCSATVMPYPAAPLADTGAASGAPLGSVRIGQLQTVHSNDGCGGSAAIASPSAPAAPPLPLGSASGATTSVAATSGCSAPSGAPSATAASTSIEVSIATIAPAAGGAPPPLGCHAVIPSATSGGISAGGEPRGADGAAGGERGGCATPNCSMTSRSSVSEATSSSTSRPSVMRPCSDRDHDHPPSSGLEAAGSSEEEPAPGAPAPMPEKSLKSLAPGRRLSFQQEKERGMDLGAIDGKLERATRRTLRERNLGRDGAAAVLLNKESNTNLLPVSLIVLTRYCSWGPCPPK